MADPLGGNGTKVARSMARKKGTVTLRGGTDAGKAGKEEGAKDAKAKGKKDLKPKGKSVVTGSMTVTAAFDVSVEVPFRVDEENLHNVYLSSRGCSITDKDGNEIWECELDNTLMRDTSEFEEIHSQWDDDGFVQCNVLEDEPSEEEAPPPKKKAKGKK